MSLLGLICWIDGQGLSRYDAPNQKNQYSVAQKKQGGCLQPTTTKLTTVL